MRGLRALLAILIVAAVAMSCKKVEGYGGKSTIYGKVLERKFDNSGQFETEFYVPEKRVYIIFGDDDFYSDEIRTDQEGKFKFSFLYAGKYTLFTYSECSPLDPCESGTRAIELTIEISNNGDVVVTDDLVTENW